MLHPSNPSVPGRYFEDAQSLGNDAKIVRVDDDPFPGPVTCESRRMCWWCEGEIVLIEADYIEVIIRYENNYGCHGTSKAKFCSRECWRSWATADDGPR